MELIPEFCPINGLCSLVNCIIDDEEAIGNV